MTAPTIPDCDFIRELDSGSTADVYLYHQRNPNRDVAVKVGKSEQGRRFYEGFRKEAQVMASLCNHPYIISIYGSGLISQTRLPYLLLEYAPHGSYKMIMRDRRLEVHEMLDLGVKLCGALQTAHSHGVIHRDIKPANILVTSSNQPALSDFGISTGIYEAQSRTGFSIPWAPAEVLTGEGGGRETSDIYSLAATLYGLLVGKSPFEYVFHPSTQNELAQCIVSKTLPRHALPDVPEKVERILLKAMANDPENRYLSALQFGRALQQVQKDCGFNTTPLIAEGRSRFPTHHQLPHSQRQIRVQSAPMHQHKQSEKPLIIALATVIVAAIIVAVFALVIIPRTDTGKSGERIHIDTTVAANPKSPSNIRSEGNKQEDDNNQDNQKDGVTRQDANLAVPQAVNLIGTSDGRNVTFTWDNPKPEEGDAYAWAEIENESTAPGTHMTVVHDTKVLVKSEETKPQTCIQVSIIRPDGRMSDSPTTACAITKQSP
ncbi:serine/threonine-protein kinase [Bifidobacterium sp. ESL0745]|uniref:serine/threonine protein kinase n=1 Tax=Bifidobacterium sp. ESL0745 TaxID=2983226 RepID=UPI0023FA2EC2|nr:serine/threonine-protein kinase [Bifidobacterium sp. ESL0745]MDF7665538.1 serine/threonine-protein kinase [Bifidobacterium sp. ESL0745]